MGLSISCNDDGSISVKCGDETVVIGATVPKPVRDNLTPRPNKEDDNGEEGDVKEKRRERKVGPPKNGPVVMICPPPTSGGTDVGWLVDLPSVQELQSSKWSGIGNDFRLSPGEVRSGPTR